MIGRMLCLVKGKEEDGVHFAIRWERAINEALRQYSNLWSHTSLRKRFLFAGHIARLYQTDPGRLSHRMLMSRNICYLKGIQSRYGSRCHGRRFKAWRWEAKVCNYLSPEWHTVAQSRRTWHELVPDFIHKSTATHSVKRPRPSLATRFFQAVDVAFGPEFGPAPPRPSRKSRRMATQ